VRKISKFLIICARARTGAPSRFLKLIATKRLRGVALAHSPPISSLADFTRPDATLQHANIIIN
jgi:hypothetical protein